MTAGRPRKPLELKRLQGTDQPCRRGPKIAGSFEVPRMPYGMPEMAVPYWRKLAPLLARRGVLVESDVPALADMCLVKARLDDAEKQLDIEGYVVNGARGVVRNPVGMMASAYRAAWLVYCARFALTPSDRARVTVEKPVDKSLAEQLNEAVRLGELES